MFAINRSAGLTIVLGYVGHQALVQNPAVRQKSQVNAIANGLTRHSIVCIPLLREDGEVDVAQCSPVTLGENIVAYRTPSSVSSVGWPTPAISPFLAGSHSQIRTSTSRVSPMGAKGIQTDLNPTDIAWAKANLNHLPPMDDGVYERMISGMEYDAMGPEYVRMRILKHEIASEYNELRLAAHSGRPASEATTADVEAFLKERQDRIRTLFGKVGTNPFVEPPLYVDYGFNISVGDNFYCNFNLTILDGALVRIGNNVMIGPNVTLTTATHPLEMEARVRGDEYALPITIHDGAWIGASATILPGVTVGEGSVVAAGAVVSKDVAPHTVVGGVPANFIRNTKTA